MDIPSTTGAPIYRGPERRSPERLGYETSRVLDSGTANGIRQRIRAILNDNPDNVFSPSARETLREEFGNIVMNRGSLTVHTDHAYEENQFGSALIHRDPAGVFHTSEIPKKGTIHLRKTPFVTIPKTPANPDDIHLKTGQGELRFEFVPAQTMAVDVFQNGEWQGVQYLPAGTIEMDPTADRYGQDIFGGNRALKLPDGRVVLFRPDLHAKRFHNNAGRLLMPQIPIETLIEIYVQIAKANRFYIPDPDQGSLYIAPGERASSDQIGLVPNKEYIFTCLAAPAGKIYSKPAKLYVERDSHRAARGGVGNVKAAGNYAPTFKLKAKMQKLGFDDIIYLDERDQQTRELSSSNIFFVTGDGILVTPDLSGEILNGVTRDSILVIAGELIENGLLNGVQERPISPDEYLRMKEAFSCGTGVTINSVRSITDGEKVYEMDISQDDMGPKAKLILDKFQKILSGEEMNNPRYKDWLIEVQV